MRNIFLSTRPMFGANFRTYLLVHVRIFGFGCVRGRKSARLEVNYLRVALSHHAGRHNAMLSAMLSLRARYRGFYSIKYRKILLG